MYLAGVTAWGAWLGRGQTGGQDYFLGNRELPWVAVMLSVVATETSTLTFLSIPGVSYLGTLGFLQLTFGYLVGRVVVSMFLLPAYYRGDLSTAYALLEERFGQRARRFASAVFMVTRLLADSVRLFATAIPLALVTGWDYPVSIVVIGAVTLVYTYFGGIKAVVWVDAVQMGLYLVGALVAMAALQVLTPDGWAGILSSAGEAGKLAVLDLSFDFAVPYTLWAGVLGGGFLTMASHGTDQLIVQRLLTCRDLTASKKALVGSGVVVIGQFLVFLMVGLGLWVYYEGRTFGTSDEIFARFVVEELPPGISGLLVAGVFAAAMSSLSSSINSLASATAYDFWAPLAGAEDDEAPHAPSWEAVHTRVGHASCGRGRVVHPAQRGEHGRRSGASHRFHGLRRSAGDVRSGDSLTEGRPTQCHRRDDRGHRGGHGYLAVRPGGCGVALVRTDRYGGHRGCRLGAWAG